jgi:hypothetical protein
MLGMRSAGLEPWRLGGTQRACSVPVEHDLKRLGIP